MSDWTSTSDPKLERIVATATSVANVADAEACYSEYLGYGTRERAPLCPSLAASWGAPRAAGSPCVTMQAPGEADTFIRLVESPVVPTYRPLTTFGWTAFEIIVHDVHALAQRLAGSPFEIIGPPKPLQFMPSIVAMQVIGPGGECIYFTMESGDRESSILPPPSGFVGRTFIVVCAGPEFGRMLRWYVDGFALRERPVRRSKVAIVQQAQGLGADHAIDLSAIGMRQRGNLLELDAYPRGPGFVAGPRPREPGFLPPGNALVSVEVQDLDAYTSLALSAPAIRSGAVYRGRRACTLVGPAGELLELIETG